MSNSIMNILEKIRGFITMKILNSFLRHGLTSIGSALVALGVLTDESLASFIDVNVQVLAGLIIWLIGYVPSLTKALTNPSNPK